MPTSDNDSDNTTQVPFNHVLTSLTGILDICLKTMKPLCRYNCFHVKKLFLLSPTMLPSYVS